VDPTLGEIYRLVESLKIDFAAHERSDADGFDRQDQKRHDASDRLQPRLLLFEATVLEHTKMIAAMNANLANLAKANIRNSVLLSGALVTLLLDLLLKVKP
jgi:hypothetical protein